jgi:hypothetical protein
LNESKRRILDLPLAGRLPLDQRSPRSTIARNAAIRDGRDRSREVTGRLASRLLLPSHMRELTCIDVSHLATVTGGAGINFGRGAPAAIQEVKERAATCRALHAETQRLSGGRDPRPGTDAYAMAAATRACWASIGKS